MTRMPSGGGALLVACLLVAGCASSPPPHYYALTSTAAPAAAPSDAAPAVVIGSVTLPAEVDSPLILVEVGGNERRPLDQHRWSGPLERNLGEVLAADLASALGGAHAAYRPGNAALVPDYRVAVDVGRFESRPGSSATLDAEWTVRRVSDGVLKRGHTLANEAPAGESVAALVAAHSRAVGTLARDIATTIEGLSH